MWPARNAAETAARATRHQDERHPNQLKAFRFDGRFPEHAGIAKRDSASDSWIAKSLNDVLRDPRKYLRVMRKSLG